MNEKELAKKIMRQSYYWLTMEHDYIQFMRNYQECQIHGNLSHIPPSMLQNLTSLMPFSAWGIDIMGKITPPTSNGHEFIVVAVNYFLKWIEAESFKKLGAKQMARFNEENFICRYGVPQHIVTDNGGCNFKLRLRSCCRSIRYGIISHHNIIHKLME